MNEFIEFSVLNCMLQWHQSQDEYVHLFDVFDIKSQAVDPFNACL